MEIFAVGVLCFSVDNEIFSVESTVVLETETGVLDFGREISGGIVVRISKLSGLRVLIVSLDSEVSLLMKSGGSAVDRGLDVDACVVVVDVVAFAVPRRRILYLQQN